jgi:hypothetical protein
MQQQNNTSSNSVGSLSEVVAGTGMSTSLEKGLDEIKNLLSTMKGQQQSSSESISSQNGQSQGQGQQNGQPITTSVPRMINDINSNTLPKINLTVDNANDGIQELRHLIPTCKIVLLLLIAVLGLCILSLIVNLLLSSRNRQHHYEIYGGKKRGAVSSGSSRSSSHDDEHSDNDDD